MPESLFDLAARISADFGSTDKGLTDTQKKVMALAEEFKQTEAKANTSLKSIAQTAEQTGAKVKAGTDKAKAGTKEFSDSTFLARAAIRALGAEASSVAPGPLGNMARQLTYVASSGAAVEGAFGGVLGSLALLTGGVAVGVGIIAGAATTIYELASGASELTQELYNANARTNVSITDLGAMGIAAEESGGSLRGLTMALGLYESKMEQANEGNKAQHKLFTTLKIDTQDASKGFRELIVLLTQLHGAQQVGVAKEFFGRGYRDILAAIKEMQAQGGDLDNFIARLQKMGLILGDEDVAAGHKFQVQLVELGHQWDVLKVQIGEQFFPIVEAAMRGLSAWLKDNGDALRHFAGDVADTIKWLTGMKELIGAMSGTVISIAIIRNIVDWYNGSPVTATPAKLSPGQGGMYATPYGPSTPPRPLSFEGITGSAAGERVRNPLEGLLGRSGGGRGGRGAKQEINEVADALRKQSDEIQEAWARTDKYQKTIDSLVRSLEKKHKSLTEDQKAQLDANAATLAGIDLMHSWWDFLRNQNREIDDARMGIDQYEKAIRAWEDSERKAGRAVSDGMLAIARQNAVVQRSLALTRERIALTQTLTERLERQRYVEDKNFPRSVGIDIDDTGATRKRRATQLPDWLYSILPGGDAEEKLHAAADNIASILGKGIRDGFEHGAKEGLRSLALSFLETIEQMSEQWLASSIFRMLQGAFTPGAGGTTGGQITGGGNWFLKALKFVLPFIGAAVGGGISAGGGSTGGGGIGSGGWGGAGGGYASGLDYVPYDNFPAILHKGERVMTASENRQSGATVNHYHTWNIVTQDARSFMGQDTQRQIAQKMNKFQLHAQLTG